MRLQLLPQRALDLLVSLGVLAAIAGVAYADSVVTSNVSLGFLYILPLILSSLVHRLPATLTLAVACVVLREWFGPFHGHDWRMATRDAVSLTTRPPAFAGEPRPTHRRSGYIKFATV